MDQKGSKVLISDRPPLGISMADLIPYEPRVLNAEGSFRLLIASDSISELPGEHFNRTILGHRLFAQLSKDYLKRSWQHTSADDYVEFMLSTSKNKRFEDDCSVLILQG